MNADGSDATTVVPSSRQAFSPQWSPDGTQIAYREGCELWTMSPDGDQASRVLDIRTLLPGSDCGSNSRDSENLAWSPDGNLIAVIAESSSSAGADIILTGPGGNDVQFLPVSPKFLLDGITWQPIPPASPNEGSAGELEPLLQESEVVVDEGGRLDALDTTTGDRRTLVTCTDPCDFFNRYALSADGQWLAYEVWTCLGALPCESEAGIWVTNALGEDRQLTQQCDPDSCHQEVWAWSPQGATLAVYEGGDVSKLFTIDPQTGDRTTLATPDVDVSAIAWSPDGKGVVYAATGLQSVDLGSGETTRLTDLVGDVEQHRVVSGRDAARARRPPGRAGPGRGHERGRIGSTRPRRSGWSAGTGGTSVVSRRHAHRLRHDARIGRSEPRGHFSFEVWVIGADGSERTRLFHGDCCIGDWDGPVWSPDGRRIAFFDDVDVGYGTWLVVNADGTGGPTQIDELEVKSWRSDA